jgi:hypothetical protein
MLLHAHIKLLDTLAQRSTPEETLATAQAAAAAAAVHVQQHNATPQSGQPSAAAAAVQQAVQEALDAVGNAQEGMLELVQSLLALVGQLSAEMKSLQRLLHTPQDLLGVRTWFLVLYCTVLY